MCLQCIYGVIYSVCKLIFKIYTQNLYPQNNFIPPKSKLLLITNLPPCAAGSPQGCPWKCIETFLYQSQGSNLCAMSGYCNTCTATFPFWDWATCSSICCAHNLGYWMNAQLQRRLQARRVAWEPLFQQRCLVPVSKDSTTPPRMAKTPPWE